VQADMKRALKFAAWLLFLLILVVAGALLAVQGRGTSARPDPPWIEARAALLLRGWLTPPTYKGLRNPVTASPENFAAARQHFADHCASCHANDGSGNTEMGRSFYPKAPDMRLPRTQQLSDGEIYYFIENGIRMTGMPAWSTGTPEGEKASWELVHFIRRLSTLTPEDLAIMERFNPTSREQIEEEQKVEDFLNGGDVPLSPPSADPHAGHGPVKPVKPPQP
jgi:mono/diheme cytochrome c family protein